MSAPRTVIAVHIPKTAGTSLRSALAEAFGAQLRIDDADRPLQHGALARRAGALSAAARTAGRRLPTGCVIGHFLAIKYAFARDRLLSVWLRDPVQRVISRYHHYQRASAAGDSSHASAGLVPGLSLEQFVEVPRFQNTMSEYLWGVDLERFDFVGLVEHWDEDFSRFFNMIGRPVAASPAINRNPTASERLYQPTPVQRAQIEARNDRDVALYRRALERRYRA